MADGPPNLTKPTDSLLPGPAPYAGYGTGPVPPGATKPPPRPTPLDPQQLPLASFGSRALAALVDLGLVAAITAVLTALVTAPFSIGFFANETVGVVAVVVGLLIALVVASLVALAYAPLTMSRWDGQTPGKKLVGIRVVRVNGARIDFWWAALREVLLKVLALHVLATVTLGLVWLVNFLWPLWDAQKRAGHDFVAGSRVVRA